MQKAVETELEKLIKKGHVEKLEEVGEDIFVSPVVVTRKSDGSVIIALDAVELNRQIVRKTMQMPILAEFLDQIAIKISEGRGKPLFISTIDLKYAYGQIALYKNTAKHCVAAIVGGKATGHYRFLKGFYGLADTPVVFQSKIDRVLDYSARAWQDDIIVASRGTEEEHLAELERLLKKLEDSGYRVSIEKSKLFQKETEWCGYQINSSGIKPKTTRTESVLRINAPKSVNEIRSFLGSVQYLANFIKNLSAKTEPLRKLLRTEEKWIWGDEQQSAFEKLKEDIANITVMKYYDPEAQTILTTDASTKGLGATLWQIDENNKRAVAFASRFHCRAEKRYAINELELLAVKWAVEHFKFYLLGRKIRVETDHKALVSVFGRQRLNKEYSSRLTKWRVRLLPFEFEVVYQPGSKMVITDYLSRSPHLEAPAEPPDETELKVALNGELEIQKNRAISGAILSKWEADSAAGNRVNHKRAKRGKIGGQKESGNNTISNSQTSRRLERRKSKGKLEMPSETIRRVCRHLARRPTNQIASRAE